MMKTRTESNSSESQENMKSNKHGKEYGMLRNYPDCPRCGRDPFFFEEHGRNGYRTVCECGFEIYNNGQYKN